MFVYLQNLVRSIVNHLSTWINGVEPAVLPEPQFIRRYTRNPGLNGQQRDEYGNYANSRKRSFVHQNPKQRLIELADRISETETILLNLCRKVDVMQDQLNNDLGAQTESTDELSKKIAAVRTTVFDMKNELRSLVVTFNDAVNEGLARQQHNIANIINESLANNFRQFQSSYDSIMREIDQRLNQILTTQSQQFPAFQYSAASSSQGVPPPPPRARVQRQQLSSHQGVPPRPPQVSRTAAQFQYSAASSSQGAPPRSSQLPQTVVQPATNNQLGAGIIDIADEDFVKAADEAEARLRQQQHGHNIHQVATTAGQTQQQQAVLQQQQSYGSQTIVIQQSDSAGGAVVQGGNNPVAAVGQAHGPVQALASTGQAQGTTAHAGQAQGPTAHAAGQVQGPTAHAAGQVQGPPTHAGQNQEAAAHAGQTQGPTTHAGQAQAPVVAAAMYRRENVDGKWLTAEEYEREYNEAPLHRNKRLKKGVNRRDLSIL